MAVRLLIKCTVYVLVDLGLLKIHLQYLILVYDLVVSIHLMNLWTFLSLEFIQLYVFLLVLLDVKYVLVVDLVESRQFILSLRIHNLLVYLRVKILLTIYIGRVFIEWILSWVHRIHYLHHVTLILNDVLVILLARRWHLVHHIYTLRQL